MSEQRGTFSRANYREPDQKLIRDMHERPHQVRRVLGLGDDVPVTRGMARTAIEKILEIDEVWLSDTYQVAIRKCSPMAEWPGMLHLSIKRLDREPLSDWREIQRIKNELIGPECEFVELYPAESRLVDAANQTHLWGFVDPCERFPFGFFERLVSDYAFGNSKQRAFRDVPAS